MIRAADFGLGQFDARQLIGIVVADAADNRVHSLAVRQAHRRHAWLCGCRRLHCLVDGLEDAIVARGRGT